MMTISGYVNQKSGCPCGFLIPSSFVEFMKTSENCTRESGSVRRIRAFSVKMKHIAAPHMSNLSTNIENFLFQLSFQSSLSGVVLCKDAHSFDTWNRYRCHEHSNEHLTPIGSFPLTAFKLFVDAFSSLMTF